MENNFLKNYWFWVLLVLVVGGLSFYFKFSLPASRSTNPSASPFVSGVEARLSLILADGQTKTFQGQVIDDMTILDVLNSASKNNQISFRYTIGKTGDVTILSLNKTPDTGVKKWHFYLDGKLVPTSDINKTTVQKGDLIEIKFE